MYDAATILVVLGAVLFILAILGGGITVKEVQVPPIQSRVRILLYPVSIAFIFGGIWLSRQPPPETVLPTAQPTSHPEVTTPAIPVGAAAQPGDPFSCMVWTDDFSQTSAWGNDEVDWGRWAHENGEYRMSLFKPYYLAMRCSLCDDLRQQVFRVAVTARTPRSDGSWGIYFWNQDKISYSFELDKDGNAMIKKYDKDNNSILVSQNMELKGTNQMTVEYRDGSLSGYINGGQVLAVPMAYPPVNGKYGVGLIQESLSSDSADVYFDDFSFSGCP